MSGPPATSVEDVVDQPLKGQFEAFLDEHRRALHDCLDGLTEAQARRSLVPSRTTLLGLVKHATFVEKVWFDEAITCRSRAEIGIPATPHDSFVLADDDTIDTVRDAPRAACAAPAGRRPPCRSTTSCGGTGAARCRCAGSNCTCCASSPSTAGTPTSCASRCSPSRNTQRAADAGAIGWTRRERMLGLELIVVLGATLLLAGLVARRTRVAPPIVLLVCGALLGFVPALREVHLPPEAMLLIFLPALLYWESLTTSLREIRSNLRAIVLLSTLLVIATAAAVAAVGHGLGLPWGPAWVLGAALAPTDATAVGVLARALPRRTVTTLRAESLINDGTALVVYGLAIGVTAGEEHLGLLNVSGLFLLSYVGGALAGAVVAFIAVQIRRPLD